MPEKAGEAEGGKLQREGRAETRRINTSLEGSRMNETEMNEPT